MDWRTTSTILEGLRDSGDGRVWERFVTTFREPIRAFARARGLDAEAAEDVAQEVLLSFHVTMSEGRYDRGRGRLRDWLYGIARNHVRRAQRRQGRPTRAQSVSVDRDRGVVLQADEERDWAVAWERVMLETCMRRARAEVTAEQWQAFELSVRSEADAEAIAAATGLTVKAVYNARHRILGRLRRLRTELEGPDP